MNAKNLTAAAMLAILGLALVTGVFAIAQEKTAQEKKDSKTATPELKLPADFKLPPGWTAADMQACMLAGTPGKMHEHLAQGAGVWLGKSTMWMAPGAEPIKSECTSTVTPIMDGRYIKVEIAGEIPGVGPFNGQGHFGFDNVSQQFVASWIDNHSTGMMRGTGELSKDGKTLTWTYSHNCPITKKPTTMRDVETITGTNTKTIDSFATDPKSGKEFQMMRIELTKK